MNNGFEVLDVREQPEYQEMFDFAGELGEQVINAAGDQYGGLLEASACWDILSDLLSDYFYSDADEGPKDWSPKLPQKVGHRGIELLCDALRKGDLNETDMFIRDSLTFAWEKAYLPTDDDIDHAVNEAKEWMGREYPDLGPIWEPLYEQPPFSTFDTESKVVEGLMGKIDWAYGMSGKLVLTFNFIDAAPVWLLQSIDKKLSKDERDQELVFLRNSFMKIFWKTLQMTMDDSNADNRVDWRKQWKEELKDKPKVEAVQKELLEYLKGRRYS